MEQWAQIDEFPNYKVSSLGRIYNTKNQRFIKPVETSSGYLVVCLYKDACRHTPKRVHRLVAQAFIPNINNWPDINHIDENKRNNTVSNLEWCTPKYNSNYGTRTQRAVATWKANPKAVEASRINGHKAHEALKKKVRCLESNQIFNSAVEAAKILGLDRHGISATCRGLNSTAGGLHWEFA